MAHPRVGGEDNLYEANLRGANGSPPRRRGRLVRAVCLVRGRRLTPA